MESLSEMFGLCNVIKLLPRYNISPAQYVGVILEHSSRRGIMLMRWGLIPHWFKKMPERAMINARAETLPEKPSYKYAFQSRRCLIPANGFYEWDKDKQPYYFAMKQPFAMAGLWERWKNPSDGRTVISCTIITTASDNEVHDRMPAVIMPENYGIWLNTGFDHKETLQALLSPLHHEKITVVPVSRHVNNAANDGEELIRPSNQFLNIK